MVDHEDIPYQHEFTCSAATVGHMSRATAMRHLRQGMVGILAMATTLTVLLLYLSDVQRWRDRLVGAAFWAVVLTLASAALLTALSYLMTRRNVRATASAGSVMRTGFGRDELITENSLSSSRFSYDAVESIDHDRDLVFVTYRGQVGARIYPVQLFPPEVVERLQERVAHSARKRPRVQWRWLNIVVGLVLIAILAIRHDDGPRFCSDLRRIDEPVARLRAAVDDSDFDRAAAHLTELRDAYRSIDPPPEIDRDWPDAIDYFDHMASSARSMRDQGRPLERSPEVEARHSAAMARVTDHAVAACDHRRQSFLVP